MNKKIKLGLMLLLSASSLVACNKKVEVPELGEIKVPKSENKEPDIVEEKVQKELSIDASMKNQEQEIYTIGTFNDGGLIDGDDFASIMNENIEKFVSANQFILQKSTDGNIYFDDITKLNTVTVEENETDYEPFKLGTKGVYVLSINGDKSFYKVITSGNKYEINSDKELILADSKNAYLFDDGKFYIHKLGSDEDTEVKVTVDGDPVNIKDMYDRFDNDTLMFHVGNTVYLARLTDISMDGVALSSSRTIKADDVKEIIRDNKRNDNGRFLYRSTNGKLKVYDKFQNKVTIELPDIIASSDITPLDASVYYGDKEKGDYIIYFTDFYKTYRYVAGDSQLFRVKQEPMSRFEEHTNGLATVKDNKIMFKFVTYGDGHQD